MALASLAVVVPLLAAALLAGTTSLRARRVADVVALMAAAATAGLCLALVARSSDRAIVAWLGGWHPRGSVALGIDLYADPLAAGLAGFAALLTVAGLLVAWHQVDTAGHLFHALVLTFLFQTNLLVTQKTVQGVTVDLNNKPRFHSAWLSA